MAARTASRRSFNGSPAPAIVAALLACALRADAAATGTSVRARLRGPLLEALQFHIGGRQSPGPTSVPSGGASTSAGEDENDDIAGPATVGSTSSYPVSGAANATSGAAEAQTPAPRFDEGVVKEDLQAHSARSEDTLVDSIELAQVSEMKRVVFRALSRLRSAQIHEFDSIAKLQTGAIDDFNDHLNFRAQYGVNHTDAEDDGGELPAFLPGDEPWWSASGGPDWTQDLDNSTSDDRQDKTHGKAGKAGQTADGAPCICYPELLQVSAPNEDAPVSSALAEIRSCCADIDARHLTALGL